MGKYILFSLFLVSCKKTRCNNNLVDEMKSRSAKYSRVNLQNEDYAGAFSYMLITFTFDITQQRHHATAIMAKVNF